MPPQGEPNYWLYKDGEKVGKILHIYGVGLTQKIKIKTKMFKLITTEEEDELKLRRYTLRTNQDEPLDILELGWTSGHYSNPKTGEVANDYELLTLQPSTDNRFGDYLNKSLEISS